MSAPDPALAANGVPHLSAEEFRRLGRELIDWIADYHTRLDTLPVLSQARPREIYRALPEDAPRTGEPFAAVKRDLDEIIVPGLTHWQSPSFFGFFPANASGPAILGELLSAGLGVQGMIWATSPACTELEMRVLDWLVDMLDLPKAFKCSGAGGGVIQDTASSATLCALLAARERITEGRGNEHGVDRPMSVYASNQAHSSVEKAVAIAGIGRRNLRLIDVDERYALDPGALARAVEADVQAGYAPVMVCATVGTTSSLAIDPVRPIGEICRRHGIWLHVDAAMAGTAALCPEFRDVHDGLELADSYCFNPHKWMLTNFDCDCFWVTDRNALINSLSIAPEYLRNQTPDGEAVFDYRNWHVPLGRRFRALKLWMVIRHYGVEGLQAHVRLGVELAGRFADWVRQDDRFVLGAEPRLNLVCFRHVDGDGATRTLLEQLNASGDLYVTHTRLDGRYVIRFSIGATHTELRHVEQAWSRISEAAADLPVAPPTTS
ncbi:MAG: pyridoxal-dependent decarboxylase [Planctomycetota bacterium]|jgi:aromatic-L-amino-acid decarboxylase